MSDAVRSCIKNGKLLRNKNRDYYRGPWRKCQNQRKC